jgi:ABC-2 type transport system permease protein
MTNEAAPAARGASSVIGLGFAMRSTLRKARTLLSVYYALMVEYRAELVLWGLAGILPLIMMGIWRQAALGRVGAAGAVAGGMTADDFTRYFLAVFLVRQLTVVWVIWEFDYQVLEGRLSPYLLQPLDVVWRYVAQHLSEQAARLPFGIVVVGAFVAVYHHAFQVPRLTQLLWAVPVIYLAFTLRFLMQYTVAMLAFWVERAAALEQVMFLLYLFLSGMIAPLAVYPEAVRRAVLWTPFPYLIDFPANLLIGRETAVQPWQGVGMMLAWIAVFLALNRWVWRRGLRRYSAMGA